MVTAWKRQANGQVAELVDARSDMLGWNFPITNLTFGINNL